MPKSARKKALHIDKPASCDASQFSDMNGTNDEDKQKIKRQKLGASQPESLNNLQGAFHDSGHEKIKQMEDSANDPESLQSKAKDKTRRKKRKVGIEPSKKDNLENGPLKRTKSEKQISLQETFQETEPKNGFQEDPSNPKGSLVEKGNESLLEKSVDVHDKYQQNQTASPNKSKQKHNVKQEKKSSASVPVLPWMRSPIEVDLENHVELSNMHGMHPELKQALTKRKIKELFPVQVTTWNAMKGGYSQAHDFCICAPTGSGKTLAYALPILQALRGRAGQFLGALVILPTKELAVQVFEVFKQISPSLEIWTMILASHNTIQAESKVFKEYPVDILISTPGRLMAHLNAENPPFTLSSLKFLVVDESDRLLRQSYQDWLPNVLEAIDEPIEDFKERSGLLKEDMKIEGRVVKLIVSATLTQDPAKLARLNLHYPRYIAPPSNNQRYAVPKELRCLKLVGAAVDKVFILEAILEDLGSKKTLIFTGSLPATHRLYAVLKEIHGKKVVEFSSNMAKGQNSQALQAFKSGSARILVASDALSRGLDVPGVDLVINYDAPAYPKTYVHRAGRTARAGKTGMVITLLSGEQVHHHKAMISKIDNASIKDYILPVGLVKSRRKTVQEALEKAAEILSEADQK